MKHADASSPDEKALALFFLLVLGLTIGLGIGFPLLVVALLG